MRQAEGTHEAVLRALERANRRHRRPCTAAEVIAELPSEDVRLLRASYLKLVPHTVSYLLRALLSRGVVWTSERAGLHRNFYASPSVLDRRVCSSPEAAPRRQRVLALMKEAVAHYRRPIRAVDIRTYLEERGQPGLIQNHLIVRDLLSLKESGELQVIAIRGDRRGFNTYLPAGIDAREYQLDQPPTWMEEVRAAFYSLWQDRLREAEAECRKPRPVSTSEVRTRLRSADDPHPSLRKTTIVANALIDLSRSGRPVIRRVKRYGSYSALWAPLDVPDERLDVSNTYVTDCDRLSVAVRRACEVHARPVTVREVAKEIGLDEALRRVGDSNRRTAIILTTAAKETYRDYYGERLPRSRRPVRRVGVVGPQGYYWHGADGERAAEAYVSLLKLKYEWKRLRAEERVNGLDGYCLPSAAIGHALLLLTEAEALAHDVKSWVGSTLLDESARLNAGGLLDAATDVTDLARLWLSLRARVAGDLPSSVVREVSGWTAAELRMVLQPLSLSARQITKATQIVALVKNRILRVPNPSFINRFDPDHLRAALYLYDRTDALLFTARRWGNEEALFQAGVAASEVGRLRDARFVLPGLMDEDFERRLAAVASLAFLPATPETSYALQRTAKTDPDHSVREAAGWAHRLVTSPLDQIAILLTE